MLSKRLQMHASVVFFAAAIWLAGAAEYQWIRNTVDETYEWAGRRLAGHVIAGHEHVLMVTQCARRCQLVAACASFNFVPALRRCELNSASHVTDRADLVADADSQYYLRDAFTIDPVGNHVRPAHLLTASRLSPGVSNSSQHVGRGER